MELTVTGNVAVNVTSRLYDTYKLIGPATHTESLHIWLLEDFCPILSKATIPQAKA